ncbi:MAG: DUF1127 domain-containing protein [Aquabacterium sp.]
MNTHVIPTVRHGLIDRLSDWVDRSLHAWRAWRAERATRHGLQSLDHLILRDLGISRCEIYSLAARHGEHVRQRAIQQAQTLDQLRRL